jgi:cytochrome P450
MSSQLYFPHLGAFVSDWLVKAYARRLGHAYAWCPEWYQHFEAMSRLDALWRAWETLRQDGAVGMSVWWRDHADHHMAVLLDPDGPFGSCRGEHTEFPTPDLPVIDPPAGLFEDERGAAA